ncbi:MAG: hypothetical protein H0X62_16265 [Bacteroidetes bacterium]|nr:hypothetical protein [Bacteroidota bacterium]
MFDYLYNVAFKKVIGWLLPTFLRTESLNGLLTVFKEGLEVLKTNFTAYRLSVNYSLQFSGQKKYLEHYLNDKFDPIQRGIFISNSFFIPPKYFYNKAEQRIRFRYNRWKNNIVYIVGDIVVFGIKCYKAVQINTAKQPDISVEWIFHREVNFLNNRASVAQSVHFYVNVPNYIGVTNLLILNMKQEIDKYNLVTKNYQIIPY